MILTARIAIVSAMLLISSMTCCAQEFVIGKKIRLRNIPVDYFLHSNNRDLYVFEDHALHLYDLQTQKFIQTIDTIPGLNFSLLSGDSYLRQFPQEIVIRNLSDGSSRKIPFTAFKAVHFALDRATGSAAISSVRLKDGIYLYSQTGDVRRITLGDTTSLLIAGLSLSPQNGHLFIKTVDKNFYYNDLLIYDLTTQRLVGSLPHTLSRQQRLLNDSTFYALNAWGDIDVYNIDPLVETQDGPQEQVTSLTDHDSFEHIINFCFLHEGLEMLSVSESGIVSLWEVSSGNKMTSALLQGSALQVKVSADGSGGLVLCKDTTITVVGFKDLPTHRSHVDINLVVQTKQKDRITRIINDPINNYVYTYNGYDHSGDLKIWDRSNLLQVRTFPKTYFSRLSSDHRHVVSDKSVIDISRLRDITPYEIKRSPLTAILDYDSRTKRLLVLYYDTLRYIDQFTSRPVVDLVAYEKYFKKNGNNRSGSTGKITLSRHHGIVATEISYASGICTNWIIALTGLTDGKDHGTLSGMNEYNSCLYELLFSDKYPYLISNSRSKVIIWDFIKKKRVLEIVEKEDWGIPDVYAMAIAKNNDELYLGYHNGRIIKWNLATLKKVREYRFSNGSLVSAIEFIDNKTAFVASENNLCLYDFEDGMEITSFGNPHEVNYIDKVLVDEKRKQLYSLQDSKLFQWDLTSLLAFNRTDPVSREPKYIKDIAFNTDTSAIVCTDLFINPNWYSIRTRTYTNGKKIEVKPYATLSGEKAVALPDGRTIVLNSYEQLYSLAIYDASGNMVRNFWDSLRFYGNYFMP